MRPDSQRHFLALELSPGASANDIRGAYRKLIQKWHPDRFAPGSLMQTTAEDQTKELNEAYEWLYKKRHYRKFLSEPGRPKAQPVARPVEPEGPPPDSEAKRPKPAAEPSPAARPSVSGRLAHWGRRQWRWPALSVGVAAGIYGACVLGSPLVSRWRSNPHVPPPNSAPVPVPPLSAAASPASSGQAPDRNPARVTAPERPGAERQIGMIVPTALPQSPALASMAGLPTIGPKGQLARTESPVPASAREWGRAKPLPAAEIGLSPGEPSAEAKARAERDRRLDDAETDLLTFDIGDTADWVKSLQGLPDEATPGAMRYGSSIVYFMDGRVSSWTNGLPRLRISPFASIDILDGIDAFTVGSTRGEVFRI